ncbi:MULTISPECIES: ABC transporter ATP-binding protein/permease [Hydrocarboniphaga]|jgi:putative ATP-binding cassette transporter|uniref:ABC transporter domain protein n=1 Tax=Hydrocarboniphaga effusa AP103 TaxID=1172194 RepID=I8HXB2_9GAMM|nr:MULTISPECIES: ABC transporter ATP-binding protein/permease [Hydrocarboniphaga]EIT67991.1 ABC transporter domain protein [Hydrocarboniphaga effusa AP103]MDZ4076950.1 ABC transporter ATP-binding protein/permease [Hydrocarboniphaga sp.]
MAKAKRKSRDDADDLVAAEMGTVAETRLGRQIGLVMQALRSSAVARILLGLIVALVVVVLATAYGQVHLNRWNQPFYDALSRRDLKDFMTQLGVFFIIVGCLLVLNVIQRWIVEHLKLRLREGLTRDLINRWMQPRRAFWLANSGSMGVNPDQRMQEDARKFTELSADLGVGLLQATILFVTFAGVLWGLSTDFSFRIGDADYAVPGFMLWAAIAYALIGSLLSYWVGRSLIGSNAERYAREADLRFALVRVNEHLDGVSLARGEPDEGRRINRYLDDTLRSMRRLATEHTNLTWVTSGFGWITNIAPTLVAVPLYFTGKISFGGLMMAAAAFTQAQSSLRWFVDNFSTIADWRAGLLRVASFRQALLTEQGLDQIERRIAYTQSTDESLRIESLQVEAQSGRERVEESPVRIEAGQRVMVISAPGTSKTMLFRALAGLWPWGSGRIEMPSVETIFYVPRGTPYLPAGSLREALAYPDDAQSFEAQRYAQALERLGLDRLVPLLDESRRWDRELGQDEQLCVAFARMLLQAPAWVLIDDAFSVLEEDSLARVVDVLRNELKATGLIHIGGSVQGHETLFDRSLHLVKMPGPAITVEEAP